MHGTTTVLARQLPRDVALYDGDLLVRRWGALFPPTAVRVAPDSTILTAEGPDVAVRDPRQAAPGQRLSGGLGCGALHAVDCAVLAGATIVGTM